MEKVTGSSPVLHTIFVEFVTEVAATGPAACGIPEYIQSDSPLYIFWEPSSGVTRGRVAVTIFL